MKHYLNMYMVLERSDYSENDMKIIDFYYPRALMETYKNVSFNMITDLAIDIKSIQIYY
ncbi:MAG: hypothetical protein ACXVHR_05535 [Methanobacterium sp.]